MVNNYNKICSLNLSLIRLRTNVLALILFLTIANSISAQEILNVTEIPDKLGENYIEEIRRIDDKIYVPVFLADNSIYSHLPNMEVDSFDTPESKYSVLIDTVRSTLFLEYEPFVGFVDKHILNYDFLSDVSIENDYVASAGTTRHVGVNNQILIPVSDTDTIPINKTYMAVYENSTDSVIYYNEIYEGRKYAIHTGIDGDFLYLNIALSWEDDEDLFFLGDTLTYVSNPYLGGSNYLSKINFITGEKAWTRHIGYGDVKQVFVDNKHRINIEIESDAEAMYNFEWIDSTYSGNHGRYDRIIYRMSPDGFRMDHTYLQNHYLPSFDLIDFNTDGSFQAFGHMKTPEIIYADGVPIDFTDAVSPEKSKGLLLVFDDDLDLKWSKKISSEGETLIHSASKAPSGEIVIAVSCMSKSITVDGELFPAPELPPGVTSLRQSILARLDNNGGLMGNPVFTNHHVSIRDIIAIGEDHLLLNMKKFDDYPLDFINEDFDGDNVYYIIEIKGDIFNSINSIFENFEPADIIISPNPIQAGGEITIESTDLLNSDLNTLKFTNNVGRELQIQQRHTNGEIKIDIPSNLVSGIYYISFKNKNGQITKPIIIH